MNPTAPTSLARSGAAAGRARRRPQRSPGSECEAGSDKMKGLGSFGVHGKENGNYYIGLYGDHRDSIGFRVWGLGLYWGNIGVILGLYWGNVGAILV